MEKKYLDQVALDLSNKMYAFFNSNSNIADLTVDANSNVSTKNIGNVDAEVIKEIKTAANMKIISDVMTNVYGKETTQNFNDLLSKHVIYVHDSTGINPYCAAIKLFPFLEKGIVPLGGQSIAPKHIQSFLNSLETALYIGGANFLGAIAIPEFFICLDYFCRKEWGDNYWLNERYRKKLQKYITGFIFTLNAPAASRGCQSLFINLSIMDKYFMESLFETFVFPGTFEKPNFESTRELQKVFMDTFIKERQRSLLTFPVVTASMLAGDGNEKPKEILDKEFAEDCARWCTKENAMFVYVSDSVDSLASCCRLRNEIKNTFGSSANGGLGVDTGSKRVISINFPLMYHHNIDLEWLVKEIHKFLNVYNVCCYSLEKLNLLPFYSAGFISMDKEFLTIGVHGLADALKLQGYEVSANDNYINKCAEIFRTIKNLNQEARVPNTKSMMGVVDGKIVKLEEIYDKRIKSRIILSECSNYTIFDGDTSSWARVTIVDEVTGEKRSRPIQCIFPAYSCMFNTELVPAESLGVKSAQWCRDVGIEIENPTTSSYLYFPNQPYTLGEQMKMHGKAVMDSLDGGIALHSNRQDFGDVQYYLNVFQMMVESGCNYWCENVRKTVCDDCNYISPKTHEKCPRCGSSNISHAVRVIGYLTSEKYYQTGRKQEAALRVYT